MVSKRALHTCIYAYISEKLFFANMISKFSTGIASLNFWKRALHILNEMGLGFENIFYRTRELKLNNVAKSKGHISAKLVVMEF